MAATLRSTVEGGEYATSSEIVREALRDWTRARDTDRRELEELRAMIREGDESGPSVPAAEVYAELRAMIKDVRKARAWSRLGTRPRRSPTCEREELRPHPRFLDYHRKHVFKG